jgi:hypothetical protein
MRWTNHTMQNPSQYPIPKKGGVTWNFLLSRIFVQSLSDEYCRTWASLTVIKLFVEFLEFWNILGNGVETSKNLSHKMLKVQETLQFANSKWECLCLTNCIWRHGSSFFWCYPQWTSMTRILDGAKSLSTDNCCMLAQSYH